MFRNLYFMQFLNLIINYVIILHITININYLLNFKKLLFYYVLIVR